MTGNTPLLDDGVDQVGVYNQLLRVRRKCHRRRRSGEGEIVFPVGQRTADMTSGAECDQGKDERCSVGASPRQPMEQDQRDREGRSNESEVLMTRNEGRIVIALAGKHPSAQRCGQGTSRCADHNHPADGPV